MRRLGSGLARIRVFAADEDELMFKLHRLLIPFVVALMASMAIRADSMVPAEHRLVASRSGQVFLALIPSDPTGKAGRTVAYRLEADGTFSRLWEIPQFIALPLLHDDGRHLVAVNAAPRHAVRDHRGQTALAFFADGVLVKSYFVEDLVRDATKIVCSVNHFEWLADGDLPISLGRDGVLEVRTIDGVEFRFDSADGKLLSTSKGKPLESPDGNHCFNRRSFDRVPPQKNERSPSRSCEHGSCAKGQGTSLREDP